MSLAEFARREIFEPLQMNSTRYVESAAPVVMHRATNYERQKDGGFELSSEEWWGNPRGTSDRSPDGGYGVISTVEDFVKWDRNFTDAKIGGRAVLDAVQMGGTLKSGEHVDYGSGLALGTTRGLRSVGHTGQGHGNRSLYMRFPDQQVSVIAFCNVDDTSVAPPERVFDIYLGEQPKAAPAPKPSSAVPSPITLSGDQLGRFAGSYWNPSRRAMAQIEATSSGLRVRAEAGESLWHPVSESEFRRNTNAQDRIVFQGNRMVAPQGFEKVILVAPNAGALDEYAGQWYSPDLDVTYRLEVKPGRLHWSWPVNEPGYDLTPFVRDQFHFCTEASPFRCTGTDFVFTRNDEGRIVSLSVSLARARNIHFQRASAKP
jgi:hypothetical protein